VSQADRCVDTAVYRQHPNTAWRGVLWLYLRLLDRRE